jgi:hypothetical protein
MKRVKKILKNSLKIVFGLTIFSFLLLAMGVNLPKQEFYQKTEITNSLIIKDCNVVDVKNGVVKQHQNIVIKEGQIVFVDTVTQELPVLADAKIMDRSGKYVMPSLWDMHIHTLSLSPQLHFPLLIANGVTGVRDMGDGDSWISDLDNNSIRDKAIWAQKSKENNLLMPKIGEACSYHVEEI